MRSSVFEYKVRNVFEVINTKQAYFYCLYTTENKKTKASKETTRPVIVLTLKNQMHTISSQNIVSNYCMQMLFTRILSDAKGISEIFYNAKIWPNINICTFQNIGYP